jgi:dihydroxyacetone kinase-like protein
MAGCSITLVKLNAEMKELWDAPVHTAAMRRGM